jgi:hypothetical protein
MVGLFWAKSEVPRSPNNPTLAGFRRRADGALTLCQFKAFMTAIRASISGCEQSRPSNRVGTGNSGQAQQKEYNKAGPFW